MGLHGLDADSELLGDIHNRFAFVQQSKDVRLIPVHGKPILVVLHETRQVYKRSANNSRTYT